MKKILSLVLFSLCFGLGGCGLFSPQDINESPQNLTNQKSVYSQINQWVENENLNCPRIPIAHEAAHRALSDFEDAENTYERASLFIPPPSEPFMEKSLQRLWRFEEEANRCRSEKSEKHDDFWSYYEKHRGA